MKRFQFGLEALLKLYSRNEESLGLQLRQISFQCSSITQHILELQSKCSEYVITDKNFSLEYLHSIEQYVHRLSSEIASSKVALQTAEARRIEIRQNYILAQRKLQAIQSIRDRQFAEYKKTLISEEEMNIDDIIASGYL